MGTTILITLAVFLAVTLLLVGLLLFAKAKLSPSGLVKIQINGEKTIEVEAGSTLLSTLSEAKIFLPSACGGGGTCAMCKCQVIEGGGEILPTEAPYFSRKAIADNWRLGCQVKVKNDMVIKVPEEIFGIKKWECEVVSNYNVASFIKEFVVKLPEGEHLEFEAGGYIQIDVPACEVDFKNMDITAHPELVALGRDPQDFKPEWDKYKLWDLKMKNPEPIFRAYSMANHPAEGNIVMLNIRIATPPWDRAKNGWMDVNPGICSSYVFNCKPGDKVTISGPYGEFFIKETEAEMLYIGGGAGMAPMRSHLFHLFHTLKSGRKVTYWYGGRSKRELFYLEHFNSIARQFPNFKFFIVLSEPHPDDNWKVKKDVNDTEGDGFVGFVHQAVIDQYLKKHEAPEDIEFYFCGPPMMNAAVLKMVDDWGVPKENVAFDDFGG
ncbi:MAG: NADH:ubiquinone reductase (Na(+)-transporting) subunit F [Flavobacteriales bacterium]|jgi:Na+-transporting NADH:ubiquinone oxidoreductase subunit F|nr:NADH:ubiquinone reductase (Na(+)-transporting) subunit F [Flavobacteriales bacterium]MBK6549064.1 NADH:ubiquinone reductase (Na(+)-transporting) subunit F [Flavobacteriales bacterium]MBK6884346.1 NADH:ubiquinone reductase (Na(+)-transporting) subunit F [Flavobacteriales bacterium]MBK7100741.1 NADH:ubiquinone reductase (Na(+)-transporting) subunit F [Flavobacteriales bacterium]MBK7111431.1 NADH:ubiquinone reductase (Na(+)-transporting) subunit F [Flavobacteriales bacterium]